MVEKIIIFVVFLAPLIFFHELGHFLFARLFKVRVETFSLGFGPKIFKWKGKETEYALSIIPLGGYVKMFGDDPLNGDQIPEHERQFSYTHKSKHERFWIVFGGPLANFILAFILFFSLSLSGEKVPEAKFGFIKQDSSFYTMGLRTGDILKKINKEDIAGAADLSIDGEKIEFVVVERSGQFKTLKIDRDYKTFMEEFITLVPRFRVPVVIYKGDKYFVGEDRKISIDEYAEKNIGKLALFKITNPNKKENEDYVSNLNEKIEFELNTTSPVDFYKKLRELSIYPIDLSIKSIVAKSPADKANLKEGDIILDVAGSTYSSFEDFRDAIQKVKEGEKVSLNYLRGSEVKSVDLIPEIKKVDSSNLKTIGVYSAGDYMKPNFVMSPGKSLIASLYDGVFKTYDSIEKTIDGFKKLIFNEVSIKNIGGPLSIGKVASDSLSISLSYFFRLMALISVNLGVINLFPIPVLDGGHILFLGLEVINRGPLSKRKMQIAQQFGVSLLFMLIFVALFNDISRMF